MIDINDPSLAIIIDLWDSRVDKGVDDNILSFLDSKESSSIETVVLASYNCYDECYGSNIWSWNHHQIFEKDSNSRTIKQLNVVHQIYNNVWRNHPTEQTNPKVLNYVNPDKFQIGMLWGWELEYYLSINPHIKNIYVFGISWEYCVRNRPLGYEALLEIPNINILTKRDCVRKHLRNGLVDFNLEPNWYHVVDDIYCYRR